MKINAKKMKLDLMLGALGALLMVVGDLDITAGGWSSRTPRPSAAPCRMPWNGSLASGAS